MRDVLRLVALAAVILYVAGFVMYYDYTIFRNWVYASRELGIHEVYLASKIFGEEFRVVYPPLAPTVFVASYELAEDVSSLERGPLNTYVERLVSKLPVVLAHLGLWYVVRRAAGASTAYWLAAMGPPLLLVLATYNFDTIMLLLAALSILLVMRGRATLAGVALGLASLSKQVAVLTLPATVLTAARHGNLRGFVAGVAAVGLVVAPFLLAGVNPVISSVLGFHAHRPPQGPTLWYSLYALSGYQCSWLYCGTWVVPFTAALAVFTLLALKRGVDDPPLMAATVYTLYLATGKVVNPVYLSWPYTFMIMSYPRVGRRALALYYAVFTITLLHFGIAFFGSVASGTPVYLPEEGRWLSPSEVEASVRASLAPYPWLADTVIGLLRGGLLAQLLATLYTHWPITSLVLSVAYTLMASALAVLLAARAVRIRGGA